MAIYGYAGSGSSLTVSYSDVQGGLLAVHVDSLSHLIWGTGTLIRIRSFCRRLITPDSRVSLCRYRNGRRGVRGHDGQTRPLLTGSTWGRRVRRALLGSGQRRPHRRAVRRG